MMQTHLTFGACFAIRHAGGLVCDPFVGSGTTPAAAIATGRQWVAFEVDQVAYETVLARIEKLMEDAA